MTQRSTLNPPPIALTILRRGDMLLVDVAELGALISRSETQVDDEFLRELTAEVSQLATPGYGRQRDQLKDEGASVFAPEGTVRNLQRIGGLIYSHLFTAPVRARLQAAESCDLCLRLDEQLIQVPWELGFDGAQFLATKFRVGRQVITGSPLPTPRIARVAHEMLKVLLIADPTQSLLQAQAEAEQLYALLDGIGGVEVTFIGGKNIRKLPLLAALQDHDVVHFAGHSEYDPTTPHKSGWRLSEGILTAAELSKLTHPPLLVFSNSCQAGTTAAWEGGYRYEGQAFGIGSAFLLAGVQNYIGTFWVVHDEESVGFALAFYRSLAAGRTLGEALHEARHATLTNGKGQGLTWASYMLYGNPTTALLLGPDRQPLSEPIAAGSETVPPPEREGILSIPGDSQALLSPQRETRPEADATKGSRGKEGVSWKAWQRRALALVGLMLLGRVGVMLWHRSELPLPPPIPTPLAQPPPPPNIPSALPLPDKPSLVILPFTNLSGDPTQEYFSDGITEEITAALSRVSGLFVIARTSAFTYKGKAAKVQDISREMGVRYVLEGSVRKADNQVRILVQLIDATTGEHLWSEHYDRPLKEIFPLQDEIVQKIVTALKVQLTPEEQARFRRAPTNNLEAYDYYLRGTESWWRAYYEGRKEVNLQARQLFERAVELDPQYAGAYTGLALTYSLDWFYQWNSDRAQSLERAFALTQRAVMLNDSLSRPHTELGSCYLWRKQHDQAIVEGERAIALDPNDADAYDSFSATLIFAGRPEEAIGMSEKAIRLNPHYPPQYLLNLGFAYRVAGRYEEALVPLKKALALVPNHIPLHVHLAVCYAELGRMEEAQAEGAELLRLGFGPLENLMQRLPYKNPADLARLITDLGKAGLK